MRIPGIILFIIAILPSAVHGLDAKAGGQSPSVGMTVADTDSDGDGLADYSVYFLKSGQKEHEEFDYNRDGEMDDFIYYADGMIVREEIDSDFDGKVDIWVFLSGGKYIKKYERDLDGDGKPDIVKDYDKK